MRTVPNRIILYLGVAIALTFQIGIFSEQGNAQAEVGPRALVASEADRFAMASTQGTVNDNRPACQQPHCHPEFLMGAPEIVSRFRAAKRLTTVLRDVYLEMPVGDVNERPPSFRDS